jgi:two-component system nitrogen regulation response regulator GlnG
MARITVVNDYPAFLETMYTILDGMDGHEVTGFEGEETTLDQLVDSAPELLIVDLRIAGHDIKGWGILVLARTDPALRDVPLIVCSTDIKTLRERADQFNRMGNVYALEKPFDVEHVTELVRTALADANRKKAELAAGESAAQRSSANSSSAA